MKIRNLNISTQLRLGLGAILLLVASLGGMAWQSTERLWHQTQLMYDHPLTVRRAVGDFETDLLLMHKGMKNLILAESQAEILAIHQDIEIRQADAFRNLEILRDRFLGPEADITALHDAFVQWNVGRKQIVELLQSGQMVEARTQERLGGDHAKVADALLVRTQAIIEFARNKADQFLQEAQAQRDTIKHQIGAALASILLLSLLVTGLLLRGIKGPLTELTAATGEFSQGKFDVRIRNGSENEFGTLATSFNSMANAMQLQIQVSENVAQLAGVMLREDDLKEFCRELLKALLEHTDSQVAAVYLLNDDHNVSVQTPLPDHPSNNFI